MFENLNYVPSPFTPVEVEESEKGVKVKVCCREYDFGKEMFPISIKAMGKEILASPIRLSVKDNGVDAVWEDKETWVQEKDDTHVVIMSAMQSRFAVISAVVTIEYDGYMSYNLRLSTRADSVRSGFDVEPDRAERIVDMMHLEVPLKKECVPLCHYSKFGSDGDPYHSGKIHDFEMSMFPHSWFGNDESGIGFYFDSDENWTCDKTKAWEGKTQGNEYLIRYHFLDAQPHKWQYEKSVRKIINRGISYTPLSFEFGIQATPVKPMDEKLLLGEHMIHIDCFERIGTEYLKYFTSPTSENDNTIVLDRLKEKGVTTLTLHQKWNKVQGYWKLGETDAKRMHTLIDEAHKRGIKIVFYFCNTLSTLRPESEEYMSDNCVISADGQPYISFYRTPPQRTYRTCAKGPDLFRDFADGMVSFLKEFNPDGVYIDSANIPWGCRNERHGCGYTDENGIRQVTYPVSNMRKGWKYIYEQIHEKLGKSIQIHPWSAFIPAYLAYCDMYWAGEAVALKSKNNTKAILEAFKPEMFRTEFSGKNIGVPCQFLAYTLPDNSWNFRTATALCASFGIYPRPINIHQNLDFMSKIWNVLDSFNAKECQFTPYFTGKSGGTCDNDSIRISSYENDNTFVLVITNPTSANLTGVKVASKYPAETELLNKTAVYGKVFEVDMPAYETLFIKCKK